MKIKKINEMSEDKIQKIDFTLNDMNEFEDWKKCVNIIPGYKNIKYNDMYNSFGISNFTDDYNESRWWILNFDNNKFAVDISSHGEGCWLHIYLPNEEYPYTDDIKQKVKNFYEQLFKQI